MTIRITAAYFCAGLVLENGKVVRAAPILHYMRRMNAHDIAAYCKWKGWRCEVVND